MDRGGNLVIGWVPAHPRRDSCLVDSREELSLMEDRVRTHRVNESILELG